MGNASGSQQRQPEPDHGQAQPGGCRPTRTTSSGTRAPGAAMRRELSHDGATPAGWGSYPTARRVFDRSRQADGQS
ncbi:hypothetical protein FNF27_00355 [Cafeteria roenbergensis]|uniref:Uncharacterized protein n=1 Tax=Cafeteria roenbergensis TaxID=33653 RepID=A0A5A8EPH1_CAFRO|nr:hypothetical protein FNF29_08091 [Cafeteria roenbergensis]KAA0168242.1 hypothetical protein FNF28_02538 [Cafeteria roenbergensis]KAA0178507.1 hypothetical protein FNF27_00355 [Cafeteria roenbergensis]|eukprot:KAA0146360.1 hypothetical protein FNF29_08091 [Cafeteria roenbergensis]